MLSVLSQLGMKNGHYRDQHVAKKTKKIIYFLDFLCDITYSQIEMLQWDPQLTQSCEEKRKICRKFQRNAKKSGNLREIVRIVEICGKTADINFHLLHTNIHLPYSQNLKIWHVTAC